MSTPIIQVENVTFQYDKRTETDILSSVSFNIYKGEWVAIVGKNGSGKSTLAQILVGLLTAQQGEITIDGLKLSQQTIWEIRRKIGIVFQNPDNQFIGTTVQDDVAFGLENLNLPYDEMRAKVDEALKLVGMDDFRLHDPSQLSGGQKQRVAIASALALDPNILLLDEAFVMLDPASRQDLLIALKQLKQKKQITIVSITHDKNEMVAADRLIVLNNGRVVNSGLPKEIFMTQAELEPPFSERLRRKLRELGKNVPNEYMTEDEMVRWLCK
ncbi:energy-coupling factor transporter ATPase [Bacillus kwashiorkori]|uniref:energy-coupling factor transporter ATPase n=1 Tax=Bacillus kwashiorkori TaxID=1522318 RepID=UPI0007828F71|nr:energy-coupling factor transporter ATPase [Bacillus kwashiorkori]